MFKHILLEVYCHKDVGQEIPSFCESHGIIPGYYCILNHCMHMSFTSHENALCYINEKSTAEEIITLGGEMTPESVNECESIELWRTISVCKINEAYDEYMKQLKIRQA